MSLQTDRYLLIGESGSGKSVLGLELVARLASRRAFTRLVVLSTDAADESPLAARCAHREEVTDALAVAPLDLERYLRERGGDGCYFEMTAFGEARVAFLARLGVALMALGGVLLVVDEAHEIADRHAPLEFLQVWTRGRKRAVTAVAITQSMKQRPAVGLHPTVLNRSSVLVVFATADPTGKEREQIVASFPQLEPHLAGLRTPHDGGPPEYGVRHAPTGRAVVRLRSGELELTSGASAERAPPDEDAAV